MQILYEFLGAIGRIPRYLFSRVTALERLFGALLPMEFISGWFSSRRYRELLLGFPALLGLTALIGFSIYALVPKEPPELSYFTESAIAARQNGEDEVADLFLRKAAMAGSGSMRDRYNQAVLLFQAKRNDEALDIIKELSPEEGLGYKLARVRLADIYATQLNALIAQKDPNQQNLDQRALLVERIEKQCELIVAEDPENLLALQLLVQINLARNEADKALSYLQSLAEVSPASNLLLGQLLKMKGSETEAREKFEKAIDFFVTEERKPELTNEQRIAVWMQIARAQAAMAQYQQGIEYLMTKRLDGDNNVVRKMVGELYFLWSDSIKASSDLVDDEATRKLSKKLELLDKALKLLPNDQRVLRRIAVIAGSDNAAGKRARDAMKRVLATGNASSVVHFVLGVSAMMQGDTELSLKHMELANRESPNTPVTLNNMAFLIASSDPPDYPKALQLIDQAIKLRPEVDAFYDTRGGIYLGLKRWSEAVTDLERALKKNAGNNRVLHESLATAYTNLGMQDLAKIHREKKEALDGAAQK